MTQVSVHGITQCTFDHDVAGYKNPVTVRCRRHDSQLPGDRLINFTACCVFSNRRKHGCDCTVPGYQAANKYEITNPEFFLNAFLKDACWMPSRQHIQDLIVNCQQRYA